MIRYLCMLLFSLLSFGLAAVPSAAFASDDHDAALEAIKRGDILAYSFIKKMTEDRLGGVVVGQKLRRTNRGWQYDLRVRRKDGKVMVAIVDAATGSIVSVR